MRMRLTIEVDYDGDISEEEARRLLNAAAEHLADNGLLSGSSDGWVASATHMVEKMGVWKTVPEQDVRVIYRCPECQTEYHIAPGEASIPYCTEDDCANAECETDFEKVEVRI